MSDLRALQSPRKEAFKIYNQIQAGMRVRRLAIFIPLILLGLLGAAYLKANHPVQSGRYFLPCIFNKFTSWHCPGCGITRAYHHLFNGRIGTAFSMNPLAMLLQPFILWIFVKESLHWLQAKPLGMAVPNQPLISIGLLVVLLLYWVLRNIPHWPFTLLAPSLL